MASSGRARFLWSVGPVALLALAVVSGGVLNRRAAASSAAPDIRTIFLRDCATCHGADGLGATQGPTLAGWGRAGLDYVLTTGRMPLPSPDAEVVRRTPRYDPATITALEDYVSQLVPGGAEIPPVDLSAGDLADGGQVFRAQCAGCHQWAGEGGALLHREAPALGTATAVQVGEAVRIGPGAMPVFGQAALSDTQLDDVVRYVRYLDHPDDRGGQPLWHYGPVTEGAVALAALALLLVALRLIGTVR
jgi:ubiquinol-cytochrome c reductase cytochrome c subunit